MTPASTPASSDWLEVLRAECARSTQTQVAKRLRVSATMICRVLRGTYPSDTSRLEARVRGELMNRTVECPVNGQILTSRCADEQRRPFAATSPNRVQTYFACRKCEHATRRHS